MRIQSDTTFISPTLSRRWWRSADFYIPAGLILLSLVPSVAGAFRVGQLATGAELAPENARFVTAPLPVMAHIIGAIVYSIVGAFQFAPRFRQRRARLHRIFGRILIPSGFVVALSGLWMSHFYDLPPFDGVAIYIMRLIVGLTMLVALTLAVVAIRQRDFRAHGAWMIRAYALALGAGSQLFTSIPLLLAPDAVNMTTRAVTMGAGWLINALVAEWVIRRYILR